MIQSWILLISIIRWMIEVGRINIITKVSLLSTHVVHLIEGHLDSEVHVMAHVGHKYNSRVVYDPLYQEIDYDVFKV